MLREGCFPAIPGIVLGAVLSIELGLRRRAERVIVMKPKATRGYILKSNSNDWETPKELYRALNNIFHFDFDPCPLDPTFDGLEVEWGERNYVNPPYSQLGQWIKKAHAEASKGKLVVMLIPSRTDTRAFHEYIFGKAQILYLKGRLKFSLQGKIAPAPFSSLIANFYGGLKEWINL
jgi:hypothetical protein